MHRSKTFEKKIDAKDWAAIEERRIVDGGEVETSKRTFADVLNRHAREVSPTKKGGRWEMIRIEKFCRDSTARREWKWIRGKPDTGYPKARQYCGP